MRLFLDASERMLQELQENFQKKASEKPVPCEGLSVCLRVPRVICFKYMLCGFVMERKRWRVID